MECKYGERGSLTVICTNATAAYFTESRYRYDHLDETLKCINCMLGGIDDGTFDMAGNQLRAVDISNSQITIIYKKAFVGLVFMESLILSNNPITKIYPGAFSGIKKVKYLELENAVSHLEANVFRELIFLDILLLKNNNFTIIEYGTFEGLKYLKLLDLSNNKLEALNEIFKPLISLEVLKLQNNLIKKIDGIEFNTLIHLRALLLDRNQLNKIEKILPDENRIIILNLALNNLTDNSIKLGAFHNMKTLQILDLSLNNFSSFPPKFFQGLYNLGDLNLYGNSIQEFSTGRFSGLPFLRSLNLSHNHLVRVNVTGRLMLTNLHKLDLSANHIESLDFLSLIKRFPKLSYVNLSQNNLSCKVYIPIKTFLEKDNIHVFATNDYRENCSTFTQEIMKSEVKKYQNMESTDFVMVGLLVTVFILIIAVAVLFYVQLIVFPRLQHTSYRVKISHL